MPKLVNILTVDVEDWFQVENYASAIPRERWPDCELRVADSVRRLLELFSRAEVRATFFVLGWIADLLPELVREIASAGHEVGSHGWSHSPIWNLDRESFAEEITRSRRVLEDLSGRPVIGYRAPTFSVTRKTLWALEELAKAGYRYDSSIFPVRHDRYGIPDAPRAIHRTEEGIWEIPLSVFQVGAKTVPVAGGGYFRLYPLAMTRSAVGRMNAEGRPAVVYVHPWEFDPGQPRVPEAGLLRSLRHRVGIGRNLDKLARLLKEYPFAPARDVLSTIDADIAGKVPSESVVS
jgi:polysaccharide deacetylase family protein (PEP-CTERM system associated)